MANIFTRWKNTPPVEQLLSRLELWFESERGRYLLASQRRAIDDVLDGRFGYHLLQISVASKLELFSHSRVQKKYRCHPLSSQVDARCSFDALPFDSESLDVVIVHHAHEFVSEPHQLIREIQRVIVPHGHVIILGFNPWSMMGLYTMFSRFLPDSFWHNHLISCRRMTDWLNLLGFEAQEISFGSHRPRFIDGSAKPAVKQWLKRWPLGNYYLISAIKQVTTLTPVKPRWQQTRNGFVGLAPVKRNGTTIANHK